VEAELPNVRFLDLDAVRLAEIFAPGEISRIYINFPDPWPKSKQFKRRLTAPSFLRMYASLLPMGGEIHFKTDNLPLFDWSVLQFEENRWNLVELTRDLHANGPVGVMTDYERKFSEAGVPIKRLVAAREENTPCE
ncbi:MAG: tRNA (guanosine(46)-N7)-methyltransferase TrmB, partial [Eubacteriales bacterium]|nr:tRNA (guanosine(46)-N7)-methyltransferase TrmB [Eubacteriales bacterium]